MQPGIFERIKAQYVAWNAQMLPKPAAAATDGIGS
jgi:hypothetical protein